jgi:hypothetical protein
MVLCALFLVVLATLTVAPAFADTSLFEFTGAEQQFLVPVGVHRIGVLAIGGTGGAAATVAGGEAAEVRSDLTVTPGETLYVEVGGRGHDEAEGGEGGFNGGGDGAGGGGGASDIRTAPRSLPLATEDTRLVVAGGGAGAGASGETAGTRGGAAGEKGEDGEYPGGGAATETEAGLGSYGCFLSGNGGNGEIGQGGAGGDSGVSTGPGGGGGGGVYGGGGGGGACTVGSSGGGGGSSRVAGFSLIALTSLAPKVQITYKEPPTITISAPVAGGSYAQGQAVAADYSCAPHEGTTVKSCKGPVAAGAPLDTTTIGPHSFTVEAEDNAGGTAIETVAYDVIAPKPAPGGGGGAAPAPDTALGAHPRKKIKTRKKKVKVKFSFSSDQAGARFECKLDKGAFAACASPKAYKVKRGSHKFSVRAVTASGTSDATPATFSFKVKKKT